MDTRKYPTIIHERVEMARRGEYKAVICRMKSGWLVLGDDQRLPGYSLILHDPIADSLNALPETERAQFLRDMTTAGDAIIEVMKPSILNYTILGNVDRALHAHIHPRYDTEEPDKRKSHPVIYQWLKIPAIPFDPDRDREMMEKIRTAVARRTGAAG
jgi:diadenosine tetraphosphate (Ap4A) HIT family hydrolase